MQTIQTIFYNYIGEYVSLLLGAMLLFVMIHTKPRKTYVYRFLVRGTVCGIIASVIQITILRIANNQDKLYNRFTFVSLLLAFLLSYNGILYYIFSYVNMMSLARRDQRRQFIAMYAVLSIIYVTGAFIEITSGGMYTVTMEGIDIAEFTRFYCFAGLICCAICLYASISNRSSISRIVWVTVKFTVPVEIVLLSAQLIAVDRYHYMFTGITYAPIFLFAFLMFHNVPYDEETGCESVNALDEFITRNIGKKKFFIMFISFVIPTGDNLVESDRDLFYRAITACRSIEATSPKIHMYRLEYDKFVNIIDVPDTKEARRIVNEIRGIFDKLKVDIKVPFNYTIISGEANPRFDSPDIIRQFHEYVAKKYADQNSSHYYCVQPSDFDDFAEKYEITVTLKDIRNRCNIDDDRVVVYAQPIYSVETGGFRVAEALMRIRIGEKLISPDKFIPLAEETGCVHALTGIILNKVCKAVQQLEEFYDFDAISINVSSKELSDPLMYEDLLGIIENYEIDITKIRMEITESAMFDNFETANRNMEILSRAGIQFYLDDFGTGYSSIERVMNCPFKTIKFDKALLYKSLDDERMDDLMAYMIEVFKKNGFVTLVEGVEDECQNKYSMDKGFDYIQGYHYAKPLPIEDLKKFFSKKSVF